MKFKKPSILDQYKSEIAHLHNIGVSTMSICRIINNKYNLSLYASTYGHYIKSRLLKK